MAVEYEIASDIAVISEVANTNQLAHVAKFYTGAVTYDDEASSKFATVTIDGKSQRVMLCIAVNGNITYDDVPCKYSTVDGHRCLNVVEPNGTETPDDVPSVYETMVVDGKTVRAIRCVLINQTPIYDGVSSVCTFVDSGKTHTAQLVNVVGAGAIEVIVKGTSPLVLPDAVDAAIPSLIAFGGTEQGLPDGYTALTFIENASGTYIDLGVPFNDADSVLEVTMTAVNNTNYVASAREGNTMQGIAGSSTAFKAYIDPVSLTSSTTKTAGHQYKFTFTANNGDATFKTEDLTASTSDTQTAVYTVSQTQPTAHLGLFGNSYGNVTNAGAQFYGLKYTVAGEVVLNLVPCKKGATIGVFDLISRQFLTPTQGSLVAGADTTLSPTPDNPVPVVCNNGELKWDSVNQTVYADGTQETINVHSKNLWNPDPTSYEYFDVTASSTKRYGHTYRNGTYTVKQNGTGGTATIYSKLFSNGSYGVAQAITTARTFTVSGDDVLLVYSSSGTATDTSDYDIQVERGATATDYQPYFDCGSAVAEMLLAIGDDIDQQEIIDGTVTRNIGWYVFDGSESFGSSSAYGTALYINNAAYTWNANRTKAVLCTHFLGKPMATATQPLYSCFFNNSRHFYLRTTETAANFKLWLKDLYDAGTPMIVFFVGSSTRTDTVTAQPIATQQGDNVAEITQASMDGLELEVTYNAGVTLTVEEVQDAQLSPDVEVTIQ